MSWAIKRETIEEMMANHVKMLGLPDAPDPESEQWSCWVDDWYAALKRENCPLPSLVSRALSRVREKKQSWWREQLPATLEALRELRAENYAQSDGPVSDAPSDLASARLASADCDACNGSGWVPMFHRDHNPTGFTEVVTRDGEVVRQATRVLACCSCAMGRHLLRVHRDEPDLRGKIHDAIVLVQRRGWLTDDPTDRGPAPDPGTTDWRGLAAAWGRKASQARQDATTRARTTNLSTAR